MPVKIRDLQTKEILTVYDLVFNARTGQISAFGLYFRSNVAKQNCRYRFIYSKDLIIQLKKMQTIKH